MIRTDRAVSTTVNYVLLLGIMTILVAVLLVTSANIVQSEQERAVENGVTVVANSLAADLESTATLAASMDEPVGAPAGTVSRLVDLPADVAGTSYSIRIEHLSGDDYRVTVWSASPTKSASVTVVSATPIAETTLNGGTVRIDYTNGGSLEVTNG